VGTRMQASAELEIFNKTWFYEDESLEVGINVENTGNIHLSGIAKVLIDGKDAFATNFTAPLGTKSLAVADWDINAALGNHSIQAIIYSGDAKLAETKPTQFEVIKRPEPGSELWAILPYVILAVLVVLILLILFSKRQEIKEHLWRRKFGKSFGRS